MKKKATWYSRLTSAELNNVSAKFESSRVDYSDSKPLTTEMRRRAVVAKRKKPGRPRIGKGAKRVLISMESNLLAQVDRHTRKQGLSRAAFIANLVRAELKKSA